MNVIDAIKGRRSIRKYEPKSIPSELLDQLLDSARLAPSSSNLQTWDIVVVTDREQLMKLVKIAGGQEFVGECSAFLVGVAESDTPYAAVDVTIALDHLSLRAVELGLGTCWIGDFEAEPLREMLGLPEDRGVPICMTLGYPAHSPSATGRKGLSDLFHSDHWDAPWPR
ncbi:TPA: nitroreductase [Thermoplasmata archaeon]|nr:nitroreductase [Thermoplasmata archaeon]